MHAKFDRLNNLPTVKINAIPDRITDKKVLATLKKLKALQLDLSEKMDLLVVKSSMLYQQLLSPTLRGEWDGIAHKHWLIVGWIGVNGVASTDERGQDWDMLQEYNHLQFLTVCMTEEAESHHLYINVMV